MARLSVVAVLRRWTDRKSKVAVSGHGRIARAVKRGDMEDRMRMPRDPGAAWRPPDRRALELLEREGADR